MAMTEKTEKFTKYEIARIIGARALQVAMDAPLLLKISEDDLKAMHYDALRISQKEFEENALPISVHRPTPRRRKDKLGTVKEEAVSDEDIIAKEQEVEKEITEQAEELGFVSGDEAEETQDETVSEEQ